MNRKLTDTDYGNWVSTKLIYGPVVLGAVFLGLSFLHPAFIVGAAFFLAALVYIIYGTK
ncbi:MAG: hypothetical protein JW850_13420 [Thermoflexales bacterium]|nr:hypothetical protein [Thermoflexales bacterium]